MKNYYFLDTGQNTEHSLVWCVVRRASGLFLTALDEVFTEEFNCKDKVTGATVKISSVLVSFETQQNQQDHFHPSYSG